MSKGSRRPAGGSGKTRRPGKARVPRRHSRAAPSRRGGPDLIDEVADALATDHPLPFLGLLSSFLEVFAGRPTPLQPRDPGLPSLDELLESFFAADLPETSAFLAGIAGLSGDEVLHSRVRREVAARGDVLPRWLAQLDRSSATDRAVQMRHVLGDGDNLLFGVRFPDGSDVSVVVYIDHNLGSLVKDAFVVPEPLSELVETMRTTVDDADTTVEDVDPADARARITEAIEQGAMTFPPLESDTWPACRPFVEWAVRLLPAGGTAYRRPEWTDADKQALTDRFLASPHGARWDDADARALLDSLLWFGTDYGPGDPLRWSPAAVEILMADWIPRKIVADVAHLARAPGLLRAFVRFCHAERGIRTELTAETLAAVDELEPEYQQVIRTPRPQGPEALLAAIGALDPEGPWPSPEDGALDLAALTREQLARVVGSAAVLDRLDDTPLPDEAFRWEGVPDEVRDRVAEVLELVDRFSNEVLGAELRTAARRVLARVCAADPALVRRGKAEGVAAAVCWIVAKANDAFSEGLAVKDLAGWFGVAPTTPAQRAKPVLQTLGVDPSGFAYGSSPLGSSDYLTAATRADVVAIRDRLR